VIAELPSAKLSEDRLDMISVLTELGFAKSNSEARRILKEGGASVNGVKVQGEDAAISKDDLLHGRFAMVRRGKKNQGAVELV
jgi:tyrosine--tRNA ligase